MSKKDLEDHFRLSKNIVESFNEANEGKTPLPNPPGLPTRELEFGAQMFSSPKTGVFELLTHALRELEKTNYGKAILSLMDAAGLAERHPETQDMAQGIRTLYEVLDHKSKAGVQAVLEELRKVEDIAKGVAESTNETLEG